MGKGWLIPALVLLFVCTDLPVATAADGEAAVEPKAISQAEQAFQASKFAEAYDREIERSESKRLGPTTASVTPSPSFGSVLSKLVFSLIVIVGVIYGASYAAKRWGAPSFLSTVGPLKILSRQSLSSKSSVYIVAALDRFLIIGETPQGLTCLSQFADPEENQRLREKWGWEGASPGEKNRLYSPSLSPFSPNLQSHVEELERELSRMREVS